MKRRDFINVFGGVAASGAGAAGEKADRHRGPPRRGVGVVHSAGRGARTRLQIDLRNDRSVIRGCFDGLGDFRKMWEQRAVPASPYAHPEYFAPVAFRNKAGDSRM